MNILHALVDLRKELCLRVYVKFGRLCVYCIKYWLPNDYSRRLFIRSSDGSHRIKLLIYDPPTAFTGPCPVHINFHGSGFILPWLGTNGRLCTLLAKELGCIVIDADYQKGPEHRFPAAFNDGLRTVEWARENVDGQFDTSKITLSGFSAGGALALSICNQTPPGIIKSVVAFYPITDFTTSGTEKKDVPPGEMEAGSVITRDGHNKIRTSYVRRDQDLKDPRLSPLFGDPDSYPGGGRTYIISCEYDILRWEAEALKDRLDAAGRAPAYTFAAKQGHSFDAFAQEGTNAARVRDEVYNTTVKVIRKGHAESSQS